MADRNTIEAVKKALEVSKQRKFKESIELAVNLKDLDMSATKNRIDVEVVLPKGRGKDVKVAVFGSGELALKARSSADFVIMPEDIEALAEDKKKMKALARQYDFFLAEAPLMPTIGKRLGVVLGPRGKMPKPIPPNIDPKGIIQNLRSTVKLRSRDKLTFHTSVGAKDMPPEDLADNIDAVVKKLLEKLEKGKFNIGSVYIKTSMGPSVRLM